MTHIVHVAVVLVQIGANIWVNPTQVSGVQQLLPYGQSPLTEVCLAGDRCYNSTWPLEKVLAALERGSEDK